MVSSLTCDDPGHLINIFTELDTGDIPTSEREMPSLGIKFPAPQFLNCGLIIQALQIQDWQDQGRRDHVVFLLWCSQQGCKTAEYSVEPVS